VTAPILPSVAVMEIEETLTVLVVDGGSSAAQLRGQGFDTVEAPNGAVALTMAAEPRIDALVIDADAPILGGFELCRRVRAAGNQLPIVLVGAESGVAERVTGLEAGADDFLVQPVDGVELWARVRAAARRHRVHTRPADVLTYGDVRIDRRRHRAWRGERELRLTRTEFVLLACLVEHAERVLARGELRLRVWGYDPGDESNSLGVYVGYLRRKLEASGEPRLIRTVRYVGYVLRG